MSKRVVGEETVAAYVRPSFENALVKAMGSARLALAKSWTDLGHIVETLPVVVILADPTASGRLEPDSVADLLKNFPAIPTWAYVTLTAPELKAVAYLSRHGLGDVILHGTDDVMPQFASSLSSFRSIPFVTEMLRTLAPQLNTLPPGLERTVRHVFHSPQSYSSATDISRHADIPIGRLYRCFADAKLSPPKKLLIAAKVLKGCSHLLDPGASVRGVARKLGYVDARGFAEHVSQVFSKPPSAIRTELALDPLIPRLQRYLRAATNSAPPRRSKRKASSRRS